MLGDGFLTKKVKKRFDIQLELGYTASIESQIRSLKIEELLIA